MWVKFETTSSVNMEKCLSYTRRDNRKYLLDITNVAYLTNVDNNSISTLFIFLQPITI